MADSWFLVGVPLSAPTIYVPTDDRLYQTGSDRLVALRVYGTPQTFPLVFTTSAVLGRSKLCDFPVSRQQIAQEHVRFEWLREPHGTVRAINLSSKNDIVYRGEVAEREILLGAGEWFSIGKTRVYVLTEEMRVALPRLIEYLGANYALIDDLMIAAVRDGLRPFLLVGEEGCAPEPVARLIHNISHRRQNGFAALDQRARPTAATYQQIRNARGGTVFVDVRRRGRLHPHVKASLTRDVAQLHLIIAAPSPDKSEGSFPGLLDVKQIEIPSMRDRKDDIPHLLDKWGGGEGSGLRFAKLRPELCKAILKYDWPRNYDELYEFGEFLKHMATVLEVQTPTQVARDADISRSTPASWERKLGIRIELPLMLPGKRESDDDSDDGSDDDSEHEY